MIRAIIVDDEKNSRMLMRSMTEQYVSEVSIVGEASNISDAAKLINKLKPNLVFLDIEMPHGSGFKLLEQFPEKNFEVIFVTGFAHYALKAIKVRALDYLLKPVDIDELIEAVELVKKRIQSKSEISAQLLTQISIQTAQGKEFVKTKDIIYCEADGSCTWIQLNNRRLYSSKNLGEFEKILPPPDKELRNRFFRTHHRFLVNLTYIKRFDRRKNLLELSNADKLPIAQRRKSDFFNFLRSYD